MHLTIKDTAKMRRMGYTVKAMYETAKGIPFLKCGRRGFKAGGLGRKGCLKDEEILHCLWK